MQSILAPILGPAVQVPPSMKGRVAIVTGGALGIGYEISRAFAKAGCRVIMVNRKEEQGDKAIAAIQEENAGKADVKWVGCDLGSLKETKAVFSKLSEEEDRLDLYIGTSGVNANKYGLDADGIDRHMGVNWFGHFLAINTVYPLLRKTSKMPGVPAPRIVLTSSELHRAAPSDTQFKSMEEINDDQVGPLQLYGRTKLAMILGAKYGLRDKVIKPNGDNIYALSVHPGTVDTDAQSQWQEAYPGIIGKAVQAVSTMASMSPEQGAYSSIWAATSDAVIEKNWNGWYIQEADKEGKETEQASDPKLGDNLWALSEKLVKDKLGERGLTPWNSRI